MSAPLSLGDALDRLRDPAAPERYSALGDEPILVVDVSTPAADLGFASRLADLPCPTVAYRAQSASAAGASLLDTFDVHVTDEAELAPLIDAAKRRPQASASLVQLLRLSARLDPGAALTAESWVYSTLQSGAEFAAWLAERGPRPKPSRGRGPAVSAERDGDELRLRLDRPERRNAYSAEMRDALCEALQIAEADPSIRRVVLMGSGPCFSSGGDLDEFGTLPDPASAHAIRSARNAGRLLSRLADRVVARVHGPCIGAGVELPAFAATVSAHPDTTFQLPELEMGLVPGAGGTASLPRRIGRQRTAWLALSGATLDAETACDWGLVDRIEGAATS